MGTLEATCWDGSIIKWWHLHQPASLCDSRAQPPATCILHMTSERNKPLLCWVPEIPGCYLSLQQNLNSSLLMQFLAQGLAHGRCSCFFLVPSLSDTGRHQPHTNTERAGIIKKDFTDLEKPVCPETEPSEKPRGCTFPSSGLNKKRGFLIDNQ